MLITYNGSRHEDLRDAVALILQEDNDVLLNLFMDQTLAASDTTHKWAEKKLKGFRDNLTADITSGATSLTIANGANKFSVDSTTNNIMFVRIDDEYLKVTAGSGTNTLTVTRAQLGTTAAAHFSGADVFFEMLSEEGADNERDDSEVASKIYNVTQIFRKELKLSGTSQAVNSVANDLAMATQTAQKLRQLMQALRVSFIGSGVRFVDGDESQRKMAGLSYYITNKLDQTGNSLSTAMLDGAIEQLLDNGVDANDLVLMIPTKQVKRLNALKIARVTGGGMQDTSNIIRNNVDTYEFSDAQVRVHRVPELQNNRIIIGAKSKAKLVPLKGRAFQAEDIAKKGDSVEKLIVGEYTCEVQNGADAWVMLTNLAV